MIKIYRVLFYISLNALIFASSPLKIFISVDMEGIGGIGTAEMTRANGKDYQLGRKLMTAEVNAVVSAIIKFNNAILIITCWVNSFLETDI